ncbi:nucleoporin Nup85 [Schizosaccharomyces cryophilus OY26]|uniref:Nuclear pore complex protein Nup85 n=1 Tax=Schizosaccharomyces cryophilus (strain OY26 / ATCC MYA-4695 / CBS 11777 / NBRC 106824 / NRRL Y48691) TaxID=653667 RepID=S9VTX4_SCHCR|nr:nucleoporin Nup85 [Schizosaccharomyces cryophilus OY26]EPY49535.1 nucleoporin Nup85 [Schizosaccharomyces cryophilus OY26]
MSTSGDTSNTIHHIEDAPIETGSVSAWSSNGRTAGFTLHPYTLKGSTFITSKQVSLYDAKSSGPFEEAEGNLYEFQQPSPLIGPTELLVSWYELWEELQDVSLTPTMDDELNQLVLVQFYGKISSLFRSKINHVLEYFQAQINNGQQELQPTLDTLWEVESAWRCAEAIYFPSSSPYTLATAIMDWVNSYDPQPVAEDGLEIMTYRIPYQHPSFWSYVNKTAIRGLFEQTISCLESSGLTKEIPTLENSVNDIVDILKYCPCLHQKSIRSAFDFEKRWKMWRSRIAHLRQVMMNYNDIPTEVRNCLVSLLDILSGNKEEIKANCGHWQEYFSALAFLYDPLDCKNPAQVSILYQMSTAEDSNFYIDPTLEFEQLCVTLCNNQPLDAIQHSYMLDLGLAVHLADFLHKTGYIKEYFTEELPVTLREHLLLEYGETILETKGIWQVAFAYWKLVPGYGHQRIKSLIHRVPMHNIVEKDEALNICQELDLQEEAHCVMSHWATNLIAEGAYGEALIILDKAGDYTAMNRVTWEIFNLCLQNQKPIDASEDETLFDLLSTPRICSPTLASILSPAAAIHQYFICKETDNPRQAGELLIGLLKMINSPKLYQGKLLKELLLFTRNLKNYQTISLASAYDCIACLEDHEKHISDSKLVRDIRVQLASIVSWNFLNTVK